MEKKHVLATTTEKESEGWRKRSATTAGLGGGLQGGKEMESWWRAAFFFKKHDLSREWSRAR